jgi:hypothetical protein
MNSTKPFAIGSAALFLAALAVGGCEPSSSAPAGAGATSPPSATAPPPPPGASGNATDASDPQAALVSAYRAAHARQDVEAILKLYWLSGASDDTRAVTRENVEHELDHPIADIQIAPVPPGQPAVREEGGVRWRETLPVVALMTVNYDTSRKQAGEFAVGQAVFAVGIKSDRCYFTVPVREN